MGCFPSRPKFASPFVQAFMQVYQNGDLYDDAWVPVQARIHVVMCVCVCVCVRVCT